jgi:hypothetical protein
MQLVYDYADAFHNRMDSINDGDREVTANLKAVQFGIGMKIRKVLK